MVLFFTSRDPPVTIYMGRDKVENEELLKYGLSTDIWFHVDKLSSAHVYLRQPGPQPHGPWDSRPSLLVNDAAQLVKANSIEGNKKDNVTIIYTPFTNLKKTGDMATGQVSFHNDKLVKRDTFAHLTYLHVASRDNAIVNRLNKTKVEKEVDHEAERQERLREEGRKKKAEAIERAHKESEQKKRWEEEKKQRSYDGMFTEEAFAEREEFDDDDFM